MAEQILNVYYHATSISELNQKMNEILEEKNDEIKPLRHALIEKLNLKPTDAAEKIKH